MDLETDPKPPTVEEAKAALAAAEADLEAAERPFWDAEHTRIDLAVARFAAETVPAHLKELAEAHVPIAEQRASDAAATHAAHAASVQDIDRAAQAVLDARDVLAQVMETSVEH